MFDVNIKQTFCFILINGDDMDYRKRMFDLRTDNDLRQEDLANVLNITGQAYGMYENGKRCLPIEHLITLCKFYNVSADYLLGKIDYQPKVLNN